MLFAVRSDEGDAGTGFAGQNAAVAEALFGDGKVIDVARLDSAVRIEDCGQQSLRRFVADRGKVRPNGLAGAAELVTTCAALDEQLGTTLLVRFRRQTQPVFIDDLRAIAIAGRRKKLPRGFANGLILVEQQAFPANRIDFIDGNLFSLD